MDDEHRGTDEGQAGDDTSGQSKGLLDRAKDAVSSVFGSDTNPDVVREEAENVSGIPVHYRQDAGEAPMDVDESPYAGSADSQALDLAREDQQERNDVDGLIP